MLLDLKGPNLCNTTACTTSAHSIGESMWQIRRGDADIMLAGGSEAVVCKLGIGGFAVEARGAACESLWWFSLAATAAAASY